MYINEIYSPINFCFLYYLYEITSFLTKSSVLMRKMISQKDAISTSSCYPQLS
jgi:hypothetical protein